MSDEQRKRRAETWKRFAEEEGGLFEMLDGERERLVSILEDDETEGRSEVDAVGVLQALKLLRDKVQSIINTGKVDASEQAAEAERATGQTKAFH